MADRGKNSTKPKGKKDAPLKSGLRREIVAIVLGFVLLLLVPLSLFGGGGIIGRWIDGLFSGLFGFGAFILPIGFAVYAVMLILKRREFFTTSKVIMLISLSVLVLSLAHFIGSERPYVIADDGSLIEYTFFQYLGHSFSNGAWNNGGMVGATVVSIFVSLIDRTATFILFIALLAILFIVITGQSVFAILRKSGGKIYDKGKDLRDKHREKVAQRELEEAEEAAQAAQTVEYNYPGDPPPKRPFDWNGAGEKKADGAVSNPVSEPETNPNIVAPFHKPANAFENINEPSRATASTAEAVPVPVAVQPQTKADEPPPPSKPAELEYTIDVKGLVEGADSASEPIMPENDGNEEDDSTTPPWEHVGGNIAPDIPLSDRNTQQAATETEYIFPPVELLRENTYQPSLSSRAQILENSKKLEETLQSFGVTARVVEVSKGPTVTRYELSPGSGVKVSKISGLADDLALNLAAETIRVEAPIPGKSVVGIEIPNKDLQAVYLREVIDDDAFWSNPSKLSFAMGKDIAGNIVVADIARMPHLLIAGSTGSGKSVCINTLVTSIIYKATPSEVKLLMIDPKVVELSVYNGIPHLLIPVVTDPKKASGALSWAVREMEVRYNQFAESRVRDLAGYNEHLSTKGLEKLPQIVIIIDELADLMMTCGKEVEESICRLAQKARAAGIHLIVATQRPSVDVITGLIKANVPSRLAFAVSSGTDSRTILDMTGAEKLLGKGDMLFSPVGLSKPRRIQGSFISDKEVENIVDFIKQDIDMEYSEEMIERITAVPDADPFSDESDPLIEEAIAHVVEKEKASTSMLQRKFRIGYNRAARIMEELEGRGLVGPEDGAKPRKVLMTPYQHREYVQRRQEQIDEQIKSGNY